MPSPTRPRPRAASEPAARFPDPFPVQVSFRHLPVSPAVVERVTAEARKLRRYAEAILRCHAVVSAPHRRQRHDVRYAVHLEITLPGSIIAVAHEPAVHGVASTAGRLAKREDRRGAADDIYVVIHGAFDAARRRLQDRMRRRRGDVKRHGPPA
jgi:hypothetical protein